MYESPIFRKKMTKLKKNARKGGKKNKENKQCCTTKKVAQIENSQKNKNKILKFGEFF